MHPLLNTAIRAARKAGDAIVREIDRTCDIRVDMKGKNDFVTEIDRHAEHLIIETIKNAYPDHAFLAEESGKIGESEFVWIIDPLDGTTNFLHGFPHFSVSIALQHKGKLNHAVIYDPLKQELFTASNGTGALLNNKKIRVSTQKKLNNALLGTGFPAYHDQRFATCFNSFKKIFPHVAGIRRAGAASLDMAYVACARLDGFLEYGLKPWDIAAGALLVQEAGGINSEINNNDYLKTGNIVSANPTLLKAILKQLYI